MKYISLREHVMAFKQITARTNNHIKDIVLLTDDQNVIDESTNQTYQGEDLRWHYLDKKRWRGSEGGKFFLFLHFVCFQAPFLSTIPTNFFFKGWENHFPSGDRRQEMIDILTEREMVANCSIWVGTKSTYGWLFRKHMKGDIDVRILENKVPPKPKAKD